MRRLLFVVIFLIMISSVMAFTYDEALTKIDWQEIQCGTLILFTKQSDFSHMSYGQSESYNVFTPSLAELVKFLNNYEFDVVTVRNNNKTVFIIKERKQKDLADYKRFSCLPRNMIDAAKATLKKSHPSYVGFSRYEPDIDRFTCKEDVISYVSQTFETKCCRWGEDCCYYLKEGCCPCSCINDKCVC